MILYHAIWDLVYIFGIEIPWYESDIAYVWQQSICWTFIMLSGFCWSLGRRKLIRALQVLTISILISIFTITFMPANAIHFGVLSAIGSCMLIMIPLDKVFQKFNPYFGLVTCFTLFIVFRNVNSGTIGFGSWNILNLPRKWYANFFTAYIGFPADNFQSTDYFSLIPWIFLYQTGYFLYQIFKKELLLEYLKMPPIQPFSWIGGHSLIIYTLHQPVLYAMLFLIMRYS